MNKTFLVAAMAALAMTACKKSEAPQTPPEEVPAVTEQEQQQATDNNVLSPVEGESGPEAAAPAAVPAEPAATDGAAVAPADNTDVDAAAAAPTDANGNPVADSAAAAVESAKEGVQAAKDAVQNAGEAIENAKDALKK